MPTPLSMQLQKFKQSFQAQWDDHARHALADLLSSTPFTVLSSVFVASLLLQILTGLIISMHFSPSSAQLTNAQGHPLTITISPTVKVDAEGDTLAMPGEMLYPLAKTHDTIPTRSYFSITQISQFTPLKYCKTIHAINTHLLLASIILILLFFGIHVKDARYFKGFWVLLLLIGLFLSAIAWLGYILPWDIFSSTSYLIFKGILEQGIGIQLGHPTDIIAHFFSLHAMIFPILLIFLLYSIRKYFLSYSNFDNPIVYGCIILMVIAGMVFHEFTTLLPPADAVIPQSSSIEPHWFFQPIHGMISFMPVDLALSLSFAAMFILVLLPFFQSYRMRISIIAIILTLSILSAVFY